MRKVFTLINLVFVIFLSSCDFDFSRMVFGQNELREAAKIFVEENLDSAKVRCFPDDYPDNIAKFEENGSKLFSDEEVRLAFSLLTDDVFSSLECNVSERTDIPCPRYMIVDGYWAYTALHIEIPNDPDGAYISSVMFHYNADKEVKLVQLTVHRNEVEYSFEFAKEEVYFSHNNLDNLDLKEM